MEIYKVEEWRVGTGDKGEEFFLPIENTFFPQASNLKVLSADCWVLLAQGRIACVEWWVEERFFVTLLISQIIFRSHIYTLADSLPGVQIAVIAKFSRSPEPLLAKLWYGFWNP